MSTESIARRLVERGEALFRSPPKLIRFTGAADADALLNDLDCHSHLFVLACVMDRQIKAERAWLIPVLISQRLGGFDFPSLATLSVEDIHRFMSTPEPLHRFPEVMAHNFHSAVRRIETHYRSDASLIWKGNLSSAEVVRRFLAFDGVGPKIATMAANILAREFKVPMSDYYSIDVSVDVHVRRVLTRLGFITEAASVEEIVYSVRALHPSFPGLVDLPAWELGRTWCHPQNPNCTECYMHDLCPAPAMGAA